MIKEYDLRIGNWFIGGWNGTTYLQVTAGYLCSWFGGGGHMCGSFPPPNEIPLTPDILEKCGFKKGKYIHSDGSVTEEAFILSGRRYVITEIDIYGNGEIKYYGMMYFPYTQSQNCIPAQLHYVHQLQNLYYCLTGQELEVKL